MTKRQVTETRSSTAMMLVVIQSRCRLFLCAGVPPDIGGDDGRTGGAERKKLPSSDPIDGRESGCCGGDA